MIAAVSMIVSATLKAGSFSANVTPSVHTEPPVPPSIHWNGTAMFRTAQTNGSVTERSVPVTCDGDVMENDFVLWCDTPAHDAPWSPMTLSMRSGELTLGLSDSVSIRAERDGTTLRLLTGEDAASFNPGQLSRLPFPADRIPKGQGTYLIEEGRFAIDGNWPTDRYATNTISLRVSHSTSAIDIAYQIAWLDSGGNRIIQKVDEGSLSLTRTP